MANFLKTVRSFRRNPFLNPWAASTRHGLWQIRKLLGRFPVVIEREGVRIVAHKDICNGVGGLFNSAGYWDANNMRLVETLAREHLVRNLVDIGANAGVYSLIAGRFIPVIAFEPHPGMFGHLEENRELNGLGERIRTVRTALGSEDGTIRFTDELESSVNRVVTDPREGQHVIEVEIHRADTWFESQATTPSLVKIDVEGHEQQVLVGFGALLAEVDILLVECREPAVIQDKTHAAGLVGPFQYEHTRKRFVRQPNHGEDWVFLNPSFVSRLEDAGFTVHTHGSQDGKQERPCPNVADPS